MAVHVAASNPERGRAAARNVILGGADSIEHGFYLTDDLLRLMKEKGTVLVGTDFPESHLKRMFSTDEPGQARASIVASNILDRLKRAHEIGVTMAFGSDVFLELPDRTRADPMLEYRTSAGAAGKGCTARSRRPAAPRSGSAAPIETWVKS